MVRSRIDIDITIYVTSKCNVFKSVYLQVSPRLVPKVGSRRHLALCACEFLFRQQGHLSEQYFLILVWRRVGYTIDLGPEPK